MESSKVIAELCIYILTWNVGENLPNDVSLTDALALNGTTTCPNHELPDIYVLSLQETSVETKNQFFGVFHDDPWVFKVKDSLDEYSYVKIATKQLQGLLIMLFARPVHIPHMRDIETESVRTGFGGLWGNKGGVGIRLNLYGTGVVFVGAHLAAHDSELKERIEDYNQIVHKLRFEKSKYRKIFDHDLVLWFGDLNFRLDGDDSAWDIRNMVEQQNISLLIERDQLLLVREKGKAFSFLDENLPTFSPTFKFIKGTSDYDLKRRPAWCDRILFRVDNTKYTDISLNLRQLSYKSHPMYTISDHKPVSSSFAYKIELQSYNEHEVYDSAHNTAKRPPSIFILFASAYFTVRIYYCVFVFSYVY